MISHPLTGLLKVWPDAEKWPKECNMTPDPMYGGVFNGNDCRTLLKKADILQSLSYSHLEVQPFTQAFRALDKVVEACFGTTLNPSYMERISEFRNSYIDLVELKYINITPKVHAIIHHVQEFCEKSGSLGRHSEQASESVHADLKKKHFVVTK